MRLSRREAFQSRFGIRWIDAIRLAMNGEAKYQTWWGCDGLSGREMRGWFHQCLTDKINRGDNRKWRKLSSKYQRELIQDARDVRDKLRFRARVYQFRTDIFRKRCSHLLSDRHEI